jgi:hypothetical protein
MNRPCRPYRCRLAAAFPRGRRAPSSIGRRNGAGGIRKRLTEVRGGVELEPIDIRLRPASPTGSISGPERPPMIIDYKTGSIPRRPRRALLDPQLALEAAALKAGAFRDAGSLTRRTCSMCGCGPGAVSRSDRQQRACRRAKRQGEVGDGSGEDSIDQLEIRRPAAIGEKGFTSRLIRRSSSISAANTIIWPAFPNGRRPKSDEASGNDDDDYRPARGRRSDRLDGWTTVQQSIASDPQRSAWVSANAGSGKTHVLTQRVIRLLLAGARPSAILCLTYTKAAASEMSNRVFERLAEWAVRWTTTLWKADRRRSRAKGRIAQACRGPPAVCQGAGNARWAEDPDHPRLLRSAAAPVSAGGQCCRAFLGARRPRGCDAAGRCTAFAADGDDTGRGPALAEAFPTCSISATNPGWKRCWRYRCQSQRDPPFHRRGRAAGRHRPRCAWRSAFPDDTEDGIADAILAAARPLRQRP